MRLTAAQAWYGGEAAVLARRFRDAVDRVVARSPKTRCNFPESTSMCDALYWRDSRIQFTLLWKDRMRV